jgi:phosphomevalonate kinase
MNAASIAGASAPGKLVLAGEYAVTDGHRALVAAVDVRARVACAPAPSLVLEGNFARAIDAADRRELRARLPLLCAVIDELDARAVPLPALRARVDTSAFSRAGEKVGLGSSAAACSALVRALAPDASIDDVHAMARTAHRAFQGGGSGIDVAASCYGGVVSFQAGVASPAPPLPRALDWVVVFVGHGTSTQGFVDRYAALPDRRSHAARLAAAADAFFDACRRDDALALCEAIDHAREAMGAMGQAAGIDVVSAPHARVAALTRAHGGAAKPSGAGGGDVAICAVAPEARAALVAALASEAFTVLDVKLGAPGARLDRSPN